MTVSLAINGRNIRYHRVYDKKKYVGLILINNDGTFTARIAASRKYNTFNNQSEAEDWIVRNYWGQDFTA